MSSIPNISSEDIEEAAKSLGIQQSTGQSFQSLTMRESVKEEMSRILTHKLMCRSWAKKQSFSDLMQIMESISEVIESRREEEAAKKREVDRKAAVVAATLERMKEDGIDIDDLIGSRPEACQKKKQSINQKRDKYRIHIFGRDYVWAGSGKIPKVFQCFLALGNKLDTCRIPESERVFSGEKACYIIDQQYEAHAAELLSIYHKNLDERRKAIV